MNIYDTVICTKCSLLFYCFSKKNSFKILFSLKSPASKFGFKKMTIFMQSHKAKINSRRSFEYIAIEKHILFVNKRNYCVVRDKR